MNTVVWETWIFNIKYPIQEMWYAFWFICIWFYVFQKDIFNMKCYFCFILLHLNYPLIYVLILYSPILLNSCKWTYLVKNKEALEIYLMQ
jgi:hypothetical protein